MWKCENVLMIIQGIIEGGSEEERQQLGDRVIFTLPYQHILHIN